MDETPDQTTEPECETTNPFLVETIARERQKWLDDLWKHYMDRLADIDDAEEHLRMLRSDRDATALAIKQLTPRKRRGAKEAGTDA